MSLSTQEILLLNNLLYLPGEPYLNMASGSTVGDIINNYLSAPNHNYGSYMNETDWNNIIHAIQNNPQLMEVQLVSSHTDMASGGGGGISALFTDPSSGEAVVAFCGTAANEWKDDFIGGTATDRSDGISTVQQENALDWYQSLDLDGYSEITITGHSKGGNKAKYITVMDDSVSRCISFDGQGFSDEFIQTYHDQIIQNQGKISNHNVDYDYVNLLLNDIGETTYYQGHDFGDGALLENHCPNTFFEFDANGNCSMTPTSRPEEMEALDHLIHNMIRSLPEDKQQEALAFLGEIAQAGLGHGQKDQVIAMLMDPENSDSASYILAYILAYDRAHPETTGYITSVLKKFGMGGVASAVSIVSIMVQSKTFMALVDLYGATGLVSSAMLSAFSDLLYQLNGIRLNTEQLEAFFLTLSRIAFYMNTIDTSDHGDDIRLTGAPVGTAAFSFSSRGVLEAAETLQASAARLAAISEELQAVSSQFTGLLNLLLRIKLSSRANAIAHRSEICSSMASALQTITEQYQATEASVVQHF